MALIEKNAVVKALKSFSSENQNITILDPNNEEQAEAFKNSRLVYDTSVTRQPLCIAIPKDAAEVSSLVRFAAANNVDFSVRVGGHDVHGRTIVEGGLLVDLRKLDSIAVNDSPANGIPHDNGSQEIITATIGGGVIISDFVKKLQPHGLIPAFGTIPWIGYVGFATTGGYGLYAGSLGLGVDNLIGARVVNWKGEVVIAGRMGEEEGDWELLKGIKGAGGNFGVIVEASVRVHRVDKVLSGTVLYNPTDVAASFKQYVTNLDDLIKSSGGHLPDALELHPLFVNTPMGRAFGTIFHWSSPDVELGREWLAKTKDLATTIHEDVAEFMPLDPLESVAKIVPAFAYGAGSRSLIFRNWTPAAIETVGKWMATMPTDYGCGLSIHELKGKSAKPDDTAVFNAREPHYLIEILGAVVDEKNAGEVGAWTRGFQKALAEACGEELLTVQWVAMTPDEDIELRKVYGEKYDEVLRLKEKYDPKNVFRHALPRIPVGKKA